MAERGATVPLLRRGRLDLLHLLPQGRGQDRLPGRPRLHDQAVPGARQRAGPDRRRRGLLPALPRGLHQAARDAAGLQHPDPLGLPVRLRPVRRPRAALVPVASSRSPTHCNLQLPDLLRRQRRRRASIPDARRRSSACSTPWCATRASPTSCRSRAASRPSTRSSSRCSTCAQGRADQAPDGQHQRHPHRPRAGRSPSASPSYMPRLRGLPAVRLASSAEPLISPARRRSARRPRSGRSSG